MAITRDEADRLLETIGAAYDRLATTMYGLDSHPTLTYLRAAMYTGRTHQMREALLFDVGVMWAQFTTIGDILEQAATLRVQFKPSDARWIEIDRLLAGPVVTVDNAGMPVSVSLVAGSGGSGAPGASGTGATFAGQSFPVLTGSTGPGRIVGSVRVGDLAMSLQTRCVAATRRLEDTARSANAAAAAVSGVTAAMGTLADLARSLGDGSGVGPLERRTAMLRDQVLSDPLTYAPNGVLTAEVQRSVAELAADLATAQSRLRTESGLRDNYPDRIAALLDDLDVLVAEETETAAAFGHATQKIAATGLPPAPSSAAVLRNRIGELDALHVSQQWRRLADDVTTLQAAIGRATERARELRAAADGLVARRDELRGRLDGYRAKAATYRLDEHDDLGPLHVQARTLLYTAPCDLTAATKAVVSYQTTLAGLLGAGPTTGGKEATR
jgi:hypothetical protein